MKKHKLIKLSVEELLISYQEAIDALELINNENIEEQQETRKTIEEIKDLIDETFDDKYFLRDENNNNIIDFTKEYNTNDVCEFSYNGKEYIEIHFTDLRS